MFFIIRNFSIKSCEKHEGIFSVVIPQNKRNSFFLGGGLISNFFLHFYKTVIHEFQVEHVKLLILNL